eukprot:scaffold2645_cov112-Isochrysis_galbana.AAC.12
MRPHVSALSRRASPLFPFAWLRQFRLPHSSGRARHTSVNTWAGRRCAVYAVRLFKRRRREKTILHDRAVVVENTALSLEHLALATDATRAWSPIAPEASEGAIGGNHLCHGTAGACGFFFMHWPTARAHEPRDVATSL